MKVAITQNEMAEKFYNELCNELDEYENYVEIDNILFSVVDLKVDHENNRVIYQISDSEWASYQGHELG